jgi:hypothetical protein
MGRSDRILYDVLLTPVSHYGIADWAHQCAQFRMGGNFSGQGLSSRDLHIFYSTGVSLHGYMVAACKHALWKDIPVWERRQLGHGAADNAVNRASCRLFLSSPVTASPD